jgi:hypothetical protein
VELVVVVLVVKMVQPRSLLQELLTQAVAVAVVALKDLVDQMLMAQQAVQAL